MVDRWNWIKNRTGMRKSSLGLRVTTRYDMIRYDTIMMMMIMTKMIMMIEDREKVVIELCL